MSVNFEAGNAQSLRIPYTPSFVVSRFTISAWVTPRSVRGTRRIFGRASSASPANEVYALEIADGQIRMAIGQSQIVYIIIFPMTTYSVDTVAGGSVPMGQTSFVAGTYDGATARVYINGEEVANASHTRALLTGNQPVSIGGDYDGSSTTNYFDGTIEGLRFYNRAISANEIQTQYTTQGSCAATFGLVLNLSMNEGANAETLPSSGTVYDMGPMGNAAFNASTNPMMFADAFTRSRKSV